MSSFAKLQQLNSTHEHLLNSSVLSRCNYKLTWVTSAKSQPSYIINSFALTGLTLSFLNCLDARGKI